MTNPDDRLSVLKSSVNLVDYVNSISDHAVRGRGTTFRTSCPIHRGDNQSAFSIDSRLGLWKCFRGCGGGTVIDLWAKMNGIGTSEGSAGRQEIRDRMPDIIEGLASEMSVVLPEAPEQRGVSRRRVIEALQSVMEEATDFLLRDDHPDAVSGREYLDRRGISHKVAEGWGIGVLPSGEEAVDIVLDVCKDERALIDGGVLIESDRGNVWAQLNGRLIIPTMNSREEVVGFSGRIIDDQNGDTLVDHSFKGKYVNTPQTVVYNKSETLYCMDLLKKETKRAIIVEGQFDAMAVNLATDSETVAVAPCGTAFTRDHAKLLEDVPEVVMLFDGDEAGQRAAIRSLWVANILGQRVSGVRLAMDQDPWDLYRTDPDSLEMILTSNTPLVSLVTESQWSLLGSEPDMIKWVQAEVPNLSYSHHKDTMIGDAARLIGQPKSKFESSLSRVVSIDSRKARKGVSASISPQIKLLSMFLLSLPNDEKDGVLSPLLPWNDRCEEAMNNWLPISEDNDLDMIKFLILGLRAEPNHSVEAAVVEMLEYTDPVDISLLCRTMIKQMLTGISHLEDPGQFLQMQLRSMRRMLSLCKNSTYQSPILGQLINMAIDIERAKAKQNRNTRSVTESTEVG